MRSPRIAALLAVAALLSGCQGPARTSSPFARPGPRGAGDEPAQDAFTILLRVFSEPDHASRARQAKDDLQNNHKWKGVYAVTQADHSELFMGPYQSIEQARPDLDKAKAFTVGPGVQPFATAMTVPLPGANPGPAEWNLANCAGAYSLLVAVFENGPTENPPGYYNRCKQDAVDYCRQLRESGEPAYYHHGVNKSSVTIGCFPDDSIRVRSERVRQPDGELVMVRKVEVVDPGLQALQGRYSKLLLNGHTFFLTMRDAQGKALSKREAETYPVRVPAKDEVPADDADGFSPGGWS